MSQPSDQIPQVVRRRWQAPQTDGVWLQVPPFSECGDLARRNAAQLSDSTAEISGRSLTELRKEARQQILQAAVRYTRQWADVEDPTADLIVVTGHQPALFHPGVWAKNFAIDRLARQLTSATALNLVIDNDTTSGSGLRIPDGTRAAPAYHTEAFDTPHPREPWQEARILDLELWNSFGNRVTSHMTRWGLTPIVSDFWPLVREAGAQHQHWTGSFTQARNLWERRWGLQNLEVPLSAVCQLKPFLWFVAHLIQRAGEFHELYNATVHEYRRVNRIRNRSHPVPDLAVKDDGIEIPFRAWKAGETQRRRLFVRPTSSGVELRDDQSPLLQLSLPRSGSVDQTVTELQQWQAAGWRLRPRALTTTLFARVLLADLFVHGIGGAKYDEMTDTLIARLWNIPVPGYWTVTGTCRLPLQPWPESAAHLRHLNRQLRDAFWNPSAVFADSLSTSAPAAVARFHAALNQTDRTGAAIRQRHSELTAAKEDMRRVTSEERQQLREQVALATRHLDANRLLTSREWSFVLYPAETLQAFLQGAAT